MALRATRSLITLVNILLLLQHISAQTTGGRWLTPDGSQSDFSTSFATGTTIQVAWKAFNNSRSDLWVTHSDVSNFPWHAKIGSNVDISVDGTYSWYINVPASTISNDNRFMLRFFPFNTPYSITQTIQYSSPGFLLVGGTTSSVVIGAGGVVPSTSQSVRTADSTGANVTPGPTTDPTSSLSTSQPATPSQSSSNSESITGSSNTSFITTTNAAGNTITATITTSVPLSTSDQSAQNGTSSAISNIPLGAQAGIGVAAGFLIILLFCAGCFFGRRVGLNRSHRKNQIEDSDSIKMQPGAKFGLFGDECTTVVRVARPPTAYTTASELDDTSLLPKQEERYQHSRGPLVELAGSTMFPVEKAGAMVRPGVHEVR